MSDTLPRLQRVERVGMSAMRRSLVAVSNPKPARGGTTTFLLGRELSPKEADELDRASRVFTRMTVRSELKNLRDAARTLLEAETGLKGNYVARRGSVHHDADQLHREFKRWLSAFRSFDVRSAHWVSRTFEGGGEALTNFRSTLSAEFDANFGYRLCCALRNASEHVGDVMNAIRVSSWSVHPGEDSRYEFEFGLIPSLLVPELTSVNKKTRTEMSTCNVALDVDKIVGAVSMSCERAFAGLVLDLRPLLEPLVRFTEDLESEARLRGGDIAVVVDTDEFEALPRGTGNLTVRVNPAHLADIVRVNFEEARVILNRPVTVVAADDLATPRQ